jgi:hypothetical protein
MKSLYITIAVLLSATLVLPSCKKGEEDKALVLKSRKKRLTGTWELTDYVGLSTFINNDGEKSEVEFEFDDGELEITTENGTFKLEYEHTLKFDEDQNMETYVRFEDDGSVQETTREGFYSFLKANSSAELKSKEAITFFELKTTVEETDEEDETSKFENPNVTTTYHLVRLTKDEMIMRIVDKYERDVEYPMDPEFNSTSESEDITTLTFVKK